MQLSTEALCTMWTDVVPEASDVEMQAAEVSAGNQLDREGDKRRGVGTCQ